VKNVAIGDMKSAEVFEIGKDRSRAPRTATAKKL